VVIALPPICCPQLFTNHGDQPSPAFASSGSYTAGNARKARNTEKVKEVPFIKDYTYFKFNLKYVYLGHDKERD